MLTADASRGAFLSGFTVVVVPLVAGLCGTARLKRTTWVAVGAALVGISLLEEGGGATATWGDFWSFASAVLFGLQVGRSVESVGPRRCLGGLCGGVPFASDGVPVQCSPFLPTFSTPLPL